VTSMSKQVASKIPTVPLLPVSAHQSPRVKQWIAEAAEFFLAYRVAAEVKSTGRDGGDSSQTEVTLEFDSPLSLEVIVQAADGSVTKVSNLAQLKLIARGDWENELLGRALNFIGEVFERRGFVPDIWNK
jgi:hypothetical protein